MFGVIFAALMMWGLNFLAAGFGASPWFEQVMAGCALPRPLPVSTQSC